MLEEFIIYNRILVLIDRTGIINNMFRKINVLIVRNILKFVKPRDNYIIFESSYNHVYDNPYYLYKYLSNFKKLHLFYVVYSRKQFVEAKNKNIKPSHILLISNRINVHTMSNLLYIFKWKTILKKCKICFISYLNFYKEYKIKFYENQIMVNLRHSQFPCKKVDQYYESLCFEDNKNLFFRIGTQESLKLLPKELYDLNCKWFVSPMPRIESIFEDKFDNFCKLIKIDKSDYNKYKFVLSLTTFRGKCEDLFFKTQFPIKLNGGDYLLLNDYLHKNNIILLIKVHHDNIIHNNDYLFNSSNIILLNDNDLEAHSLFVDNLFQYTHGLLTDYSSAFFDYLYVNKPIGFILTDFDKYRKERGFSLDINEFVCGDKIYSLDDMLSFMKDIMDNNDKHENERLAKFKLFNGMFDNNYSERVAKLFIKSNYFTKYKSS